MRHVYNTLVDVGETYAGIKFSITSDLLLLITHLPTIRDAYGFRLLSDHRPRNHRFIDLRTPFRLFHCILAFTTAFSLSLPRFLAVSLSHSLLPLPPLSLSL